MTVSKFRHCPRHRGFRHRLTFWAWLLVAVGAMLLLLLILGGVLAYMNNSKRGSSQIRKSVLEPRRNDEQGNGQIHFIFKIIGKKSVEFISVSFCII